MRRTSGGPAMEPTTPTERIGVRAALTAPWVVLLAACTGGPLRPGVPAEWQPSPNFDARRPDFVILHHTSNGAAGPALATLTSRTSQVSAHYLVVRDGRILQLVDERVRARHAGVSAWGDLADMNSASIGIELDNDGVEAYPEAQIAALLSLLQDLSGRYRIPAANYLGHADVAPRRKVDPGRLFPWKRLARGGFGLWCEPSEAPLDDAFDDDLGLRAFGYDTTDPDAARGAFKRHYVPDEADASWTVRDHAVLACLLAEKQAARER
jgi:N-acetylmuramoyl-L-alanine amidase